MPFITKHTEQPGTMPLQRDAQTFLNVIEANKGIIYKVAQFYCRNEETKKDLIQEILIQLWLSFPKYDEQYKLTTWMYRIALNVSISFYQRENRRSQINQPFPDMILSLQEDASPDESGSAVDQLYRFIKELREIDRGILLLYLEGNSQQEIADIVGLTPTNISTKISRIKQQLKLRFSSLQNE